MNDRPTASELLEAVAKFLESDVVPALEGKVKYNARVAAHVLGTVRREIECEERQLQDEWRGPCLTNTITPGAVCAGVLF